MTSQVSQTLPLFMIDTPSYSQKLPGIATRIDHCARFPPFHPASSTVNVRIIAPPLFKRHLEVNDDCCALFIAPTAVLNFLRLRDTIS